MKLCSVAFGVVFAAMVWSVGSAHAACTNASVSGTFGLFSTAAATGGVGTGNGQVYFDGNGNVSGATLFVSYGSFGWSSSTSSFTGSYAVSGNCTGTLTAIDSGNGSASHFNFVVDNSKKEAQFISTDNDNSGFFQSGFVLAQGTAACGMGTTPRGFAANLSGTLVGTGGVGYVGQVILRPNGQVAGSMTLAINGVVTQNANITGTYTENSDCTGTAAVTPKGFSTMNFSFVAVNSGTELLLVETDSNAVISGTMQQ